VDLKVVAIVFGVIFVAELPDKSLFASLVLGTRYRALHVWLGVAAAFGVQVVIAVTAGAALTLLPQRAVEAIVAVLFAVGAALLLLGRGEAHPESDDAEPPEPKGPPTWRRVAATSFVVVFLGEWGDITQIATANYAAHYDDPVSVGVGAVLALWAVAALAVTVGAKALDYVPAAVVRRITGFILLGFALVSAYAAVRG
jgi:putative Ca2+/H+ antiporter (TMEM165/GDT1 family)